MLILGLKQNRAKFIRNKDSFSHMPLRILEISWDAQAIFLSRPNRFLGVVKLVTPVSEYLEEKVHIHDPGRLKELLYPGNSVLLKREDGKGRKTKWDVIAAQCGEEWVFIHSGYHRAIAEEIVKKEELNPFGMLRGWKAEVKMGSSRIDFILNLMEGGELALEVKGCTLAKGGVALFPDAPTERGKRHLESLMKYRKRGKRAGLLLLVFRSDAVCFSPNWETDPKFAETFKKAVEAGVEIYPLLLNYSKERKKICYLKRLPLCLF